MKLLFKDLPCYQDLSKEQKKSILYKPNHAFDLSRLPNTALMDAFAAFIYDRASSLSYTSLHIEQSHFHSLCAFLCDCYSDIGSITDIEKDELIKKLKVWLVKNGQPISKKVTRKAVASECVVQNALISYANTVYDYFMPKDPEGFNKASDVWMLSDIPFPIKISPTSSTLSISFRKITQADIKVEIKEAVLYQLKRKSLASVQSGISAAGFLSMFLEKNHSEITSLKDFSRDTLEDYLAYLYLECDRRKSFRSELSALKSLLNVVGKLFSYTALRGIFISSDFESTRQTIYKSYSDFELQRLHEGYRFLDKQTARLLLIHELLGLRISDTLSLKVSEVFLTDEPYIKITQQKTNKLLKKKLNDDLVALIQASIKETEEKHQKCEYIFVSDKDPDKPMKYSALAYRIRHMIIENDLRDDTGALFTVGTHLFRHTYGRKLCDLLEDDATIAALLGHSSISSVSSYRKMSPKTLKDTTKPVIDQRNEKIKQYKKGWMS